MSVVGGEVIDELGGADLDELRTLVDKRVEVLNLVVSVDQQVGGTAALGELVDPATDVADEAVVLQLVESLRDGFLMPVYVVRDVRTEITPVTQLLQNHPISGELQQHHAIRTWGHT